MPGRETAGQDGAGLAEWRTRLPAQLDSLVAAWQDPDAWVGMTKVGGISLTGATAGGFALNELVLHGWDLAKATGNRFTAISRRPRQR